MQVHLDSWQTLYISMYTCAVLEEFQQQQQQQQQQHKAGKQISAVSHAD